MTANRHELHDLVDEIPEDQVSLAVADMRRRLPKVKPERTWPPEFFGIIDAVSTCSPDFGWLAGRCSSLRL